MNNKEVKIDISSCVFLQAPLEVLCPGKIKLGEKKKQLFLHGGRRNIHGVSGQRSPATYLESERWLRDLLLQLLATEDTKDKEKKGKLENIADPNYKELTYFFVFICTACLRNLRVYPFHEGWVDKRSTMSLI